MTTINKSRHAITTNHSPAAKGANGINFFPAPSVARDLVNLEVAVVSAPIPRFIFFCLARDICFALLAGIVFKFVASPAANGPVSLARFTIAAGIHALIASRHLKTEKTNAS